MTHLNDANRIKLRARKYPMVRNKYLRAYMYLFDTFSCLMEFFQLKNNSHPKIKKLLLRNPAGLGDILYTLRLAHAIKANNPNIKIGIVSASWAAPMINACRDIDSFFTEDHWDLNRRRTTKTKKIISWLRERRKTPKLLRGEHFDAAVDCYYYFPSGALLFYQANIPIRIGFDSNEGSPLYSSVKHWENLDIHNVEYQSELIKALGLGMADLSNSVADFKFKEADEELLNKFNLAKKQYFVFSVGTGAPNREWTEENWNRLIGYLGAHYHRKIVLVGAGERERILITSLVSTRNEYLVNLCDKLTITELCQVIRNSLFFIGLESFAGHLAAMYKVPQISIMHGATNLYQWIPFANSNCWVVRKKLKCSPCYFPSACPYHNKCMDISSEEVINVLENAYMKMGIHGNY